MTEAFDPRIVQIGIQIGSEIEFYDDLYVTAQGTKYGNQTANECQVRIDNLTREHRTRILTDTSPWAQTRSKDSKTLIVKAGRQSYGATLLFTGTITLACSGLPSEAACMFTPATIVANGTPNTSTASITVTTTAATPTSHSQQRMNSPAAWMMGMGLLLGSVLVNRKGRRGRGLFLLLTLMLLVIVPGCGGGSGSSGPPPNPGTPAGQSTVVVTGTSGSTISSTSFTLVIQ